MTQTTDELDTSSKDVTPSTESLKAHRQRLKKKKALEQEKSGDPSRLNDVCGLLIILAGVALLLALISYDPSDPSALQLNSSKHIPNNLLGKLGANIAAFSYQLFGFSSFFVPFCSFYMGWLFMRAKRVNDWFFQCLGGMTLLFVLVTFFGSLPPAIFKGYTLSPGGKVGIQLYVFFSAYLNAFGTYLFLFTTACLAILIATQLSVRELGLWFWSVVRWVNDRLKQAWAWIASQREKFVQERTQQKIIERELRKIEVEEAANRKVSFGADLEGPEPLIHEPMVHNLKDDDAFPDQDYDDVLDHIPAGPASTSVKMPARNEPVARHRPTPSKQGPDQIKVNQMKQAENTDQETFQFVKEMKGEWVLPNSYFFIKPSEEHTIDETELVAKAKGLETKLGEFSITGQMKEIHPGPVVTTYEFKPDAGIKYSKIVNMADDLCLALGAESIRIDRMPGRSSVGMEVPNRKRELITFREMIESKNFRQHNSKLLLTLGKTIDGSPFYTDLATMPHLLIAGQTGSGKSVGINAMICSILMRAAPEEVRFIMIDPKMVEMGIYADIPHLLTPVVIDPHEAANALKWAVVEMERRYRLLAQYKHRNIDLFNKAVGEGMEADDGDEPLESLPKIIVIIDEMADLMMVARGEVEESIARLAQKSRAIGIHLILATQRPSVDIITGVIKSNLPSRLSYRVSQKNDSRIILDANGAERLLGKGDGLFLGPGTSRLVRIHAPYLSETEVLDLVKFLKNQGAPIYDHKIIKPSEDDELDIEAIANGTASAGRKNDDPMYDKAARLVVRSGQASVSYLQRKLGLGYSRAAKLVDLMESEGIVGPNQGSKARDILVSNDYFDGVDGQMR